MPVEGGGGDEGSALVTPRGQSTRHEKRKDKTKLDVLPVAATELLVQRATSSRALGRLNICRKYVDLQQWSPRISVVVNCSLLYSGRCVDIDRLTAQDLKAFP